MSFTGTDVKTMAESIVDDSLVSSDVIQNLNIALIEFTELFRLTAEQTITAADNDTWYTRTAGHLAILKVVDSTGADYTGQFELNYGRDKVRFLTAGTYTVTSLIAPTAITAIGNAVAVNDVFKPGLAEFIGALFKQKDNDQNPEGLKMEAKAVSMLKSASRLIGQGDRRQGQRVPFRR